MYPLSKSKFIIQWLAGVIAVLLLLAVYTFLAGPSLARFHQTDPGLSYWAWFIRSFVPLRIISIINILILLLLSIMFWWEIADFKDLSFDYDWNYMFQRLPAAVLMLALYLSWVKTPLLFLPQLIVYAILWFAIIFSELASAELADNYLLTAIWVILIVFLPILAPVFGWFARALLVAVGIIIGVVRVMLFTN